jgi:aconitate hydratase 2/2-methylisocitrate dehydratase
VLEAYRQHVIERSTEGVSPKLLSPEWKADLVGLIKNSLAGEDSFLLGLIANRVPPGADEATYCEKFE